MFAKSIRQNALLLAVLLSSNAVIAIPALQLGPGGDAGWVYDNSDQTWVLDGFGELSAYANATTADGGNGYYAWETDSEPRTAYLSVAANPKTNLGDGDAFDISISGSTAISFFDSGFGRPPVEDPLAPHGVFNTWYEIYKFDFGGLETIFDTQPDSSGTGAGYIETFSVTVNSLLADVEGLHFDLYTIDDGGDILRFAPFSHDAEMRVPEPGSLLLLSLGLFGLLSGRFKRVN